MPPHPPQPHLTSLLLGHFSHLMVLSDFIWPNWNLIPSPLLTPQGRGLAYAAQAQSLDPGTEPVPRRHLLSQFHFSCCDKYPDAKQLRGERGLFQLTILNYSLSLWGNQARTSASHTRSTVKSRKINACSPACLCSAVSPFMDSSGLPD